MFLSGMHESAKKLHNTLLLPIPLHTIIQKMEQDLLQNYGSYKESVNITEYHIKIVLPPKVLSNLDGLKLPELLSIFNDLQALILRIYIKCRNVQFIFPVGRYNVGKFSLLCLPEENAHLCTHISIIELC